MIYHLKKRDFHKMIENLEPPYHVCFKFIRDSRRRFDLHNAIQIVADMMVEYGWLEDDDSLNLIPYFDIPEVDKSNAGVLIGVFNKNPLEGAK